MRAIIDWLSQRVWLIEAIRVDNTLDKRRLESILKQFAVVQVWLQLFGNKIRGLHRECIPRNVDDIVCNLGGPTMVGSHATEHFVICLEWHLPDYDLIE